jgi:AraC-like DNA-binding protein
LTFVGAHAVASWLIMGGEKTIATGWTGPRKTEPSYFSQQVASARRFYLHLCPSARRRLAVLSGGREDCRPDYRIRRRRFPHPILEFVSRGAGTLVLQRQSYRLDPGTAFVYGPNHPHSITTDPQFPLVKYFVVFAGPEAVPLLRQYQLHPGQVFKVTRPHEVQYVFDDLIQHALGDHPDRPGICAVVLRYLIMKMGDLALPYDQVASRAYGTYQRCRQFIEEHHLRFSSLEAVASTCHVNSAYLCRLFQRFGRESPYRYLLHLRMNHAVELLQSQGRLVKEVAEELKFSDPGNFSRAFKHCFGIAPEHLQRVPLSVGRRRRWPARHWAVSDE